MGDIMTYFEAISIIDKYERKVNTTDEDDNLFIDALKYLLENYNDPRAARAIGGFYYGKKDFELAKKYYLIAAESNDAYALDGLGYIYYYGRCGEVDYKKAFYYYSEASKQGVDEATLKLSDMYKKGLGVEKNIELSMNILTTIYEKCKDSNDPYSMFPQVAIRLGSIYIEQGRIDEAKELFIKAKKLLILRIFDNPFFGEFTNMKIVVDYLYQCITFDKNNMDIYDLLYYFKDSGTVSFFYNRKKYIIEGIKENDSVVIKYNDAWYKSYVDFLMKFQINGKRITTLINDIYGIEGD